MKQIPFDALDHTGPPSHSLSTLVLQPCVLLWLLCLPFRLSNSNARWAKHEHSNRHNAHAKHRNQKDFGDRDRCRDGERKLRRSIGLDQIDHHAMMNSHMHMSARGDGSYKQPAEARAQPARGKLRLHRLLAYGLAHSVLGRTLPVSSVRMAMRMHNRRSISLSSSSMRLPSVSIPSGSFVDSIRDQLT